MTSELTKVVRFQSHGLVIASSRPRYVIWGTLRSSWRNGCSNGPPRLRISSRRSLGTCWDMWANMAYSRVPTFKVSHQLLLISVFFSLREYRPHIKASLSFLLLPSHLHRNSNCLELQQAQHYHTSESGQRESATAPTVVGGRRASRYLVADARRYELGGRSRPTTAILRHYNVSLQSVVKESRKSRVVWPLHKVL